MKKLLLVLTLFIGLIGCSKDEEPKPDLTTSFIGTWIAQPLQGADFVLNTTWNISKASNDKVKIIVNAVVRSKDGSFPTSEDASIFNDVQLVDNRTLSFNGKETEDGVTETYEGSGIVTGNKMTIIVKTTYSDNTSDGSVKYELTKQR